MRLGPRKPYLGGMDWVLFCLDKMTRRDTSSGMAMQVVLELEGELADESILRGFETLAEPFPELWAQVRRAWHLAPYWRPRGLPPNALTPTVHRACDDHEVRAILERAINDPFVCDEQHLAAHLIHARGKSTLAVVFDHRLFDARGAESFLRRIEENCKHPGSIPVEDHSRPNHLDHWAEKFEAGRRVNAAFFKLFDDLKPRMLPDRAPMKRRRFGFREILLDEEETETVMARVEERAGLFMAMPYSLAIVFQVLHALFETRGVTGEDYVVPVMTDARGPRQQGKETLFNHFSFLLFREAVSTVTDFPRLVESLKEQMYEQVKAKLTRNLAEASLLGRIVPTPILSRVARATLRRGLASFCFSFLGETNQVPTSFLGVSVRRSYHMPTVPFPPGLGVFLRQSRDCLSAQITYAEGVLSEAEADRLVADLRSRLRS
jgi:hypothetical protein